MKDNFQVILIVVFIAAAVVGILVFSGAIPLGDQNNTTTQGTVTIWGTFPGPAVNGLLEDFNNANPTFVVKYVQKSNETFDQDLLEALASGSGPDMFFLSDDLAFHYNNKITSIPYNVVSVANFQQSFAQAGEVFLRPQGIIALPMTIDPLVMYYNRSMLDIDGIVYPPKNWDEFVAMVPTLTKRDDTNKITKSAVALGHFSNVAHAKDILSMLFMQAGNKIVKDRDGRLISDLNVSGSYGLDKVLKFYTDFADPQQNVYSWNKSFPNSQDYFITSNMAFYFGYASELATIINKNPNLNFLIAPVPQIKGSNFNLTSARVTGIAISSFSKNINTAFVAASAMTNGDFASKLANNLGMVPARRDLLAVKQNDAYSPIFYSSALYGKSWIDPSPKDTNDIFRKMIDSVISNTLTPNNAVIDASSKMSLLLNKQQ